MLFAAIFGELFIWPTEAFMEAFAVTIISLRLSTYMSSFQPPMIVSQL